MSAPIWYDSTEAGAPTLNNANGSLIALLRAVLIDGFGVKAITSISVASGVATVTCPAHAFSSAYGKWLKVTGASAPALDGVKQQTIVDANTFTYPAPGVADGNYTATDARRAPLGWTEEYNDGGANTKAIYKRTAPEALAPMLRVDDSVGASMVRTLAVEVATGIDAITGLAPTEAQVSGGLPWQKGANTAAAKRWAFVGDDRGFYLSTELNATQQALYYFGDGIGYYAGDAYFTLIAGQVGATFSATPTLGLDGISSYDTVPSGSTAVYASRGQSVSATSSELSDIAGPYSQRPGGNNMQPLTFDHIVICDTVHVIGAGKQVRGEYPGLAVPLAAAPFTSFQVIQTTTGKTYAAVPFNSAGTAGQWLIKLDDWGR